MSPKAAKHKSTAKHASSENDLAYQCPRCGKKTKDVNNDLCKACAAELKDGYTIAAATEEGTVRLYQHKGESPDQLQ